MPWPFRTKSSGNTRKSGSTSTTFLKGSHLRFARCQTRLLRFLAPRDVFPLLSGGAAATKRSVLLAACCRWWDIPRQGVTNLSPITLAKWPERSGPPANPAGRSSTPMLCIGTRISAGEDRRRGADGKSAAAYHALVGWTRRTYAWLAHYVITPYEWSFLYLLLTRKTNSAMRNIYGCKGFARGSKVFLYNGRWCLVNAYHV